MSNNHTTTIKHTYPWATILALIFTVLKLTQHIDWSWWLVLLPLYAPFALALGVLLLAAIAAGITVSFAAIGEWINKPKTPK